MSKSKPVAVLILLELLSLSLRAQEIQPYNPKVRGGYGLVLSAERVSRVRRFLTSYQAHKHIECVTVISHENWHRALIDFKVPGAQSDRTLGYSGMRLVWMHNGGAFSAGGYTYMDESLFKSTSPEEGIERVLAHELQHRNDPRPLTVQQQFDAEIDVKALASLRQWMIQQNRASHQ